MREILERILNTLTGGGFDFQTYRDLYDMAREAMKTDIPLGVEYLVRLSEQCEKFCRDGSHDVEDLRKVFGLHKSVLLEAAPYHFESYLLYIEWEREPSKKFYQPRRRALKPVVDALQDLADDKIDLLAVSLPPGVGKTTLAMFFLTWLGSKYPDEPILTGSHSNDFVRGLYDECLRVMDVQGEYLWHDVFPYVSVIETNAKDCRIDLSTNGRSKRFQTLEFTSIGSKNAGLYRAIRLLYCDDLVSGIEEALSKERLDKLWREYSTDLRQRKLGNHCKELHIATRWSVHDVIGRLESRYAESDRAKFIVVPALNENDESNFEYDYGVGYSTATFKDLRDGMDELDWRALYMNTPIEREGLLYHPDELRRFLNYPTERPDAVIGICDTKDKGKDYCFLPAVYVYGEDYYVADCVCDNGLPDVVDIRLIDILVREKVNACRFESNSAGGRVAKTVQEGVEKRKGITHITTKFTTSNKETKIIVHSDWVKKHCLFRDPSMYTKRSDYGKMMDFLCSYTVVGKNPHDDVPDGFAQLSEFAQSMSGAKVTAIPRPW